MAVLTEIKNAISFLDDGEFQEFCDIILKKSGYGVIHGLGMKAGTKKKQQKETQIHILEKIMENMF